MLRGLSKFSGYIFPTNVHSEMVLENLSVNALRFKYIRPGRCPKKRNENIALTNNLVQEPHFGIIPPYQHSTHLHLFLWRNRGPRGRVKSWGAPLGAFSLCLICLYRAISSCLAMIELGSGIYGSPVRLSDNVFEKCVFEKCLTRGLLSIISNSVKSD